MSTLQQVNALEPKRTLYILNKFVIHTVDFLNKFSTAAEDVSDYLNVVIVKSVHSLNISTFSIIEIARPLVQDPTAGDHTHHT